MNRFMGIELKLVIRMLILGLVVCATWVEAAKVYRWVDENGKVHYSDSPKELPMEAAKEAEQVEIKGPVRQADAHKDAQQRKENARWFEQRTAEREREARQREKEQKKLAKQNKKKRETCTKARNRLADAERELKARKRAGIKTKTEAILNTKIDNYRVDVDRKC